MLSRTAAGTSPRTTTSDTASRPPGFSTRNASRSTRSLSALQVDHAVRNDDVHRLVRKRDVLDFALQELDVLRPRLPLILARQGQHLVRHVQTVGLARRTHAPRRQQHVDAAARAQVQHHLAGLQLGQRRWIAAAQRRQRRLFRQQPPLLVAVEVRRDRIAAAQARLATGCAPRLRHRLRCAPIFLPDLLPHFATAGHRGLLIFA